MNEPLVKVDIWNAMKEFSRKSNSPLSEHHVSSLVSHSNLKLISSLKRADVETLCMVIATSSFLNPLWRNFVWDKATAL